MYKNKLCINAYDGVSLDPKTVKSDDYWLLSPVIYKTAGNLQFILFCFFMYDLYTLTPVLQRGGSIIWIILSLSHLFISICQTVLCSFLLFISRPIPHHTGVTLSHSSICHSTYTPNVVQFQCSLSLSHDFCPSSTAAHASLPYTKIGSNILQCKLFLLK